MDRTFKFLFILLVAFLLSGRCRADQSVDTRGGGNVTAGTGLVGNNVVLWGTYKPSLVPPYVWNYTTFWCSYNGGTPLECSNPTLWSEADGLVHFRCQWGAMLSGTYYPYARYGIIDTAAFPTWKLYAYACPNNSSYYVIVP